VEPTPNWLTPNAVCKRLSSAPKCAKARCSHPGWRGALGDCIGRDRRNIEDAPPRQLGALLRLAGGSIRCTVGFGVMAVAPWFGARWPGRGDAPVLALTMDTCKLRASIELAWRCVCFAQYHRAIGVGPTNRGTRRCRNVTRATGFVARAGNGWAARVVAAAR
jgi:hypothetical protein